MAIPTDHSDVPLAIIGMACRLPGAANLEQYWRLIVEGRTSIAEVPPERLNQELYFDPAKGVRGKSYAKVAALLSNRQFDAQLNPIDDDLRESVDEMQLLMTGVAADALRHAGLDPFNLATKNTAVFIGNGGSGARLRDSSYQAHLDEAVRMLEEADGFGDLAPEFRAKIISDCIASIHRPTMKVGVDARMLHCNMMAGTVSKAFGLTGGWLALNSACASSLQAILMGARVLQQGRADMAIVGGASDLHPHTLVLFSQAQALSANGSRPFDADADGLVICEGYGALVMKTLERALADGDPIQAVVRGLGIATDGRGKSLWAPRKEGQIKAMQRAYRSGVDISKLQYIECHATATQLGDATELETLGEVLRSQLPAGKQIPVTSVKANIGHALEAAGIAGVIKTVLCIQHQTIPPAINIRTLNPKIDWQSAPYYVPTTPTAWETPAGGQPRRAAVNAFGIGGLNMHVVLDEFTESARALVKKKSSTPSKTEKVPTADDQSVAIVGIGCILPGGIGLTKLWETLLSGRDPKSAASAERWPKNSLSDCSPTLPGMAGGFVTDFAYDWRRHKVPPKQVAEADPLQFMLLEASEQALHDAGYDRKPLEREHCGVVVGTEVGGDFCDQLEMGLRLPEMQQVLVELLRTRGVAEPQVQAIKAGFATSLLKRWPSLVDETGSFTSSTLASRVTKTLDLAGGAVAVDGGSISGLSSLAICCDMLLSGDNDTMICAAGQRRMGASAFDSLRKAGLLAKPVARNMLDADYDGVVPGEGAASVVLKRLGDARRDGDRIHAIIRGLGMAHHSSHAEALRLAAERACAQAGIDPAEIQLIELETDELLAPDGLELQALAAAHGGAARREPLTVSSPTAQFGHLGGGGGMTALIKASLEIENSQIVANVGLEHPAKGLDGWARSVQSAQSPAKFGGRRLGAIASWSKGLACYVILEQGSAVPATESVVRPEKVVREIKPAPPAAKPASSTLAASSNGSAEWKICRLAGATMDELLARVDSAHRDAAQTWSAAASSFQSSDRFRLAVVADAPAALARKLQLAGSQLKNPSARLVLEQQGVYYHELTATAPRVVFVFPGQGSQYDGMLRDLVREEPAARRALGQIDTALTRLGYPTFAQLAWPASAGQSTPLGSDIWSTQVAMLAADSIVLAALGERGIVPDLVLGHSYGEFAALYAAGAWDLETAIRLTRARCEGVAAAAGQDGGLLATDAAAQVLEPLAAGISSELHIANYNAPDQLVVGGRRSHLDQLARLLESRSHQARVLAVPAAFHTPLMRGASGLLEQALGGATIHPLRVPVASTVTNTLVRDAAEIRRNLAAQLTTPVRYAQLIEQLAAERPTVFVEVGPQQTLTRLNRRILDGSAWLVASDNPKRPGVEPLVCVQAMLECLGAFKPAAPRPQQVSAKTSSPIQQVSQTKPMQNSNIHSSIPHFDATERRRAKMRGTPPVVAPAREKNGHSAPVAVPPSAPANGNGHGNGNGNGHKPTTRIAPQPVAARPAAATSSYVAPVAKAATKPAGPQRQLPKPTAPAQLPVASKASAQDRPPAKPAVAATRSPEQLESFLVNFVVEQTGYPPEVVDLDADLEADLGIDSIKKAQLFGELDEHVGIAASVGTGEGNLSLDDFPTLRHVLNFLQANQPAAAAVPAPTIAPQPTLAAPQPASVANRAPAPVAAAVAPAPAASSAAPAKNAPDSAQLESFLVNFVVEQTGYPPEVVDLDADLEADLGIDSIKKAQLFGELDEHIGLAASVGTGEGNLSLDDFPTLRHVLNFLRANQPAAPAAMPSAVQPAPAPQPMSVAPPQATAPPAAAPATPHRRPARESVVPAGAPDAAQLESFLVNFVVEQTGYPPEVVDLDADLEADLGIDSIKKAQLFGELDEHIGLAASVGTGAGNLSLDDFPTLRHVLNFLSQAGSRPPTVDAAPVSPSHVFATADPAPAVAAAHSHQAPVNATATPADGGIELESFLINFVVEQTGYPPEVVDLDADLEADLGIDSIKKAQLFGELDEHVGLAASVGTGAGNLSLDDFPTLRHVLNFLRGAQSTAAPAAAELNGHSPAPAQPVFPRVVSHEPEPKGTQDQVQVATATAPLRLAGTPYDLGWQHGQAFKNDLRRILRSYAEAADDQLEDLPGAAGRACPQQALSADELDELQGMADAVEVPLGNLLAHHFAIGSEWGAGAGQCAVTAQRTTGGRMRQALRQPLPLLTVLAEATVPTAFLRVPTRGLAHAAIAPVGTVGLWGGLNSAGVAVTAHPLDVRGSSTPGRGRTCSSAIRAILESATDLESAIQLAGSSRSSQPWCAFVSHAPSNRVVWLEFNDQQLTVRPVAGLTSEGPADLGLEADMLAQANGDAQATSNHSAFTLVVEPIAGEVRLDCRGNSQQWNASGLLPTGTPKDTKTAGRQQPAGQPLPPPSANDVCQRFSIEMREAPLPPGLPAEPTWSGAAIVLGANPTTNALVAGLQRSGVTVYALAAEADIDTLVGQVEQICAAGPAPHLFITTPRDGAPIDFDHEDLWLRERHQAMAAPFFVCQKWMQLAAQGKWLDRCTLVATTAEEGNFGLARGAEAAQGGALAGLLKGIFVEFTIMQNERNLRIKVIDAPADTPADTLAADIFRELASGKLDYEVAFVDGRRLVPAAVERAPVATNDTEIEPGSTWIVTGGARGITAACALELGRRYGLKLHLIGSTPLTQIDPAWRDLNEEGLKQLKVSVMIAARKESRNAAQAWERTKKDIEIDRTIRSFAAAGVAATYHTCDVSDRRELARTLDEIRQVDGPIAGILHGAGLERSCRFDKKQRDVVLQTIDIKVGGAANLMALTRRDPVRHFVGFGSISGRLGGFGQTDYSLANEMLAKLTGAYRRQRPWIKAVTFHWHAWGEIGMAARPELKEILEGSGSLSFLPPQEGIAHLVRELAAGVPEPEVMITERRHWAKFSAGLNESVTPASAPEAALPLLTNVRAEGAGWVADLPLDPVSDPFLVQHRLRGRPLLPVVVGLETMAELAKAASGRRVVGFRDVDMIDGLLFHTDRPVVAKVRATRSAEGGFECELTCDFRNRAGGLIKADRLYLRATVVVADAPLALKCELPSQPEASRWVEIAYPDHAQVYHGPPFRGVTAGYCYEDAIGWARIAAHPLEDLTGAGRGAGWTVPSVVLDSAMYACGLHLWARADNIIALPRGIGELNLGRAPRDGERCVLYFVCRSLAMERPCYDFELVGEDGALLLQVRDYYKVSFGRGDAL